MKRSKLLFSISGSIAVYKSADTISKLVRKGYEIQVVASKSALKFIGAATLEGLTGKEVMTDIFKNGKKPRDKSLNLYKNLETVRRYSIRQAKKEKYSVNFSNDAENFLILYEKF